MEKQLIKGRLYALAPLDKIDYSFGLGGIFERAAARDGIEIDVTSGREDAIGFSVAQNITFEDMQPALQMTANALSQPLVLSLSQNLRGKDFLDDPNYKNAMAKEAIMIVTPKPKLSP